jgi:hypothetical protein
MNQRFAGRAIVDVQDPVNVDVAYMPQPDLALLPPRVRCCGRGTIFTGTRPRRRRTVCSSSTSPIARSRSTARSQSALDHGPCWITVPRSARGDVTEVWLVDLERRDVVVVHRDPSGDTYRQVQVVRRGEVIAPAAFSDRHGLARGRATRLLGYSATRLSWPRCASSKTR